jgi:hypothetical protein
LKNRSEASWPSGVFIFGSNNFRRPASESAGRLYFWRKVTMSERSKSPKFLYCDEKKVEKRYEPVLTMFFSGRLPRFNHARHVAVANILRHLPHGRELMHLGLQITATRAGAPEKYSREITDHYWDRLDGELPDPAEFADVFE